MLRSCSSLIFPKSTISSAIPTTPLHPSNVWSILVWKTFWAILRLKGTRLNLYLPNVVSLIDSLPRTTFRYMHFASPMENTLASFRFSRISSGVRTTWCSIWIQLLLHWGFRRSGGASIFRIACGGKQGCWTVMWLHWQLQLQLVLQHNVAEELARFCWPFKGQPLFRDLSSNVNDNFLFLKTFY